MGETNNAENAKARDLPPEVMADLQGLIDAMHDPGGIGEWASTSDSVEQRHAHTLAHQVKATRPVAPAYRSKSSSTSTKSTPKRNVTGGGESLPRSAPASTFGSAVAKSAGTFAVAAAVAAPADLAIADSQPVRAVEVAKQQTPDQATDRPQDPEVEAWARWLVVHGFAGTSASGQSVSGGVIDVRDGAESGPATDAVTAEPETGVSPSRRRRERSQIRTLAARNAARSRSFDARPPSRPEKVPPEGQPLESRPLEKALADEEPPESESAAIPSSQTGDERSRPRASIALSKSSSPAATTPLDGTDVARPLDDLVPGVLFGEVDRSFLPSQGLSSWLRYNWPFVLAGLFIVVGVILIVSVIVNG